MANSFLSRRHHIILDAYDCNNQYLTDETFLINMVKKIATLIGMNIIKGPIVAKGIDENPGFTVIAIIDFSHISIHTFSKLNEICVDIFSCKEFKYEIVKEYIIRTFELAPNQIYFSKINYDEFKIDYDWNNFISFDYLNQYYSEISYENQEILKWLHNTYESIEPKKSLLEIGGGPTIYQLLSAILKVQEITFTDYLPNNLIEIKKTMKREGFNWSEFIEYTLNLEKLEVTNENVSLKKETLIKKISNIDVLDATITNDSYINKYDIIQSSFAIESATDEISEFKRMLQNINIYLKNDGIFIMMALGGAKAYRCGSSLFPAIYLDEELIYKYFKEKGFKIISMDNIPADHPEISKYHSVFFIKATKQPMTISKKTNTQ